jgi:LmbE family N-acetylglucosaminyl deacetylase
VHWVVLSAPGRRGTEARRSAARLLRAASAADVRLFTFRDGFFPHEGAAIKEVFEGLKPIAPDVVFTHHGADRHQDHRVVAELTWNTFRDHLILEYEIPKYDGDLGQPNLFVPLAPAIRRRQDPAPAERGPRVPARKPAVQALVHNARDVRGHRLRLRGIESGRQPTNIGLGGRYAEAFHARKLSSRQIGEYEDPLRADAPRPGARFLQVLRTISLNNAQAGVIRLQALRATHLEGLFRGGDISLMAELALFGRYHRIPEPLFFRRMAPDAATRGMTPEQWAAFIAPGTAPDPAPLSRSWLRCASIAVRAPIPWRARAQLCIALLGDARRSRDSHARELLDLARVCLGKHRGSRER